MNSWFRMYAEFADDAKVQMMPETYQRRLIMLFCLQCQGQLKGSTDSVVAFRLRISDGEVTEMKRHFVSQGFIDKEWNILNWNKRQFISDSSTERTRKYRERKRTFRERHSDALDTDTDTEQIQNREKSSPEASPKSEPDSVDARILCESVGIFQMREQGDMLQCMKAHAKSSGKNSDGCIEHMSSRWEEYRSKPRGKFAYQTAYKFFMSGLWDFPDKWQAEEPQRVGSQLDGMVFANGRPQ